MLNVDCEVALVVLNTNCKEVVVTRDEHGVNVTPSIEGAVLGVIAVRVGGILGPADDAVVDDVARVALLYIVGVDGVVEDPTILILDQVGDLLHRIGVTLGVIFVDPELVVLIDREVEDGVQ